jgi:Ca2+-transporting ATPase
MIKKVDLNNLSDVKGLSEKEALEKLSREGIYEISSAKKRSVFSIVFSVIREPILLLLLASGAFYMVLGDVREALILLGFVFVILGVTLYQEHKTELTPEALRDLLTRRSINV